MEGLNRERPLYVYVRMQTTAQECCCNCGVALSETPKEDGLHPVQMRYQTNDGDLVCEACFFGGSGAEESKGQYENVGADIATAARIDLGDEKLADMLQQGKSAEELRRWMAANGLRRTRGARKMESALQAVEQDRVRVAAHLDRLHHLASENHVAICPCGFEREYGDEDLAVEAAERHDEQCDEQPKAWANGAETCLYGR